MSAIYRNDLKNREFDKEASQLFCSERETIAERQGSRESEKCGVKPMQSKTDSSGCFSIIRYPIHHVLIYEGHKQNPLLGPYFQNIEKRIQTFSLLNSYRQERKRPVWKVSVIAGEEIEKKLPEWKSTETLLVIPAGQSTNLDKVFSDKELDCIQQFLRSGGRCYFTCGSAYWVSRERHYSDCCTEQPDKRNLIIKQSRLPLFPGIAKGPLCPYPGVKYQVGFFSDAVKVTDGKNSCTVYLSGGGSFVPEREVKVLVRYPKEELLRCKKSLEECQTWDKAVVLVAVGKGGAVLTMFHPYYGGCDIDVETYERVFPDSGTDWRAVRDRLSSEKDRMNFMLDAMLIPLEDMDFSEGDK